MRQDFGSDFEELLALIQGDQPFAFVRFGDGEVALMEGWRKQFRGWASGGPKGRALGQRLRQILTRQDERFYIGTLCRGDRPRLVRYLWPRIRQDKRFVTFSRIFMYGNFHPARRFFKEQLTQDVVLLANGEARGKEIGSFSVVDFSGVDGDVVSHWAGGERQLEREWSDLAKRHNDTLFLVCAGALANVAVAHMWDCNRTNRYVDLGSLLDLEMFGRPTRGAHHPGSRFARGTIRWNGRAGRSGRARRP